MSFSGILITLNQCHRSGGGRVNLKTKDCRGLTFPLSYIIDSKLILILVSPKKMATPNPPPPSSLMAVGTFLTNFEKNPKQIFFS